MKPSNTEPHSGHSDFLKSLVEFTKEHRAARWSGTLGEFLDKVFSGDPKGLTRTSHQYIWDMLRANGFDESFSDGSRFRCSLFEDELFGVDDTIGRV
ncbi:MAG TPA: serine protein kinase, partial [Burkholderiales bacterium]|nr:serine protein kinase [Burkholderiales bacterium]